MQAGHEFPLEWERKFLVHGESWRSEIIESHQLVQGYFNRTGACRIRVRIVDGGKPVISFKGSKQEDNSRIEIEAGMLFDKGNPWMVLEMCNAGLIVKTRHLIRHGMKPHWKCYLDEFDFGLVMAEIETDEPDETFLDQEGCLRCLPGFPDWFAREVTHDTQYKNVFLAKQTKTTLSDLRKAWSTTPS